MEKSDNIIYIVAGLLFGDEGKGTTVEYIVKQSKAQLVVRYNGGAQAMHHIVLPDGQVHCFSQFGAGSFINNCNTLLSRFMLVYPETIQKEADHLKKLGQENIEKRIFFDKECFIITPMHQLNNRILEILRGSQSYGTTGMGIGQTADDAFNSYPQFFPLGSEHTVDSLIQFYEEFITTYKNQFVDGIKLIEEHLKLGENVVFEGAQGALLDRIHGIFPHITKTLCSDHNALQIVSELKTKPKIIKIGVLRIYSSRHGNGPFITNNEEWKKYLPECHNSNTSWQGNFRLGPFDLVAARYGIEIFKPDFLSITCIDKLSQAVHNNQIKIQLCNSYKLEKPTQTQLMVLEQLKEAIKYKIDKDQSIFITEIHCQESLKAYKSTNLLNLLLNAIPQYREIELKDEDKLNENFKDIMEKFQKNQLKQIATKEINNITNFITQIERELQVQILVVSCGATHLDKQFIEKYNVL